MFKRTNFVLTKCIGEILCTGIIDIICIETEFDECLLTKIDLCNKTEYRNSSTLFVRKISARC